LVFAVGLNLGPLLCAAGDRAEGLAILTRSRDGLAQLGRGDLVAHVQQIMDRIAAKS